MHSNFSYHKSFGRLLNFQQKNHPKNDTLILFHSDAISFTKKLILVLQILRYDIIVQSASQEKRSSLPSAKAYLPIYQHTHIMYSYEYITRDL